MSLPVRLLPLMWRATLALALFLGLSGPARADVPPIDFCSNEGQACNNAGNDGKSAGVCKKSMCNQLDKSTGKTIQHECLHCVEGAAPAKKQGCSTMPGQRAELGARVIWLAAALLWLGRRRA